MMGIKNNTLNIDQHVDEDKIFDIRGKAINAIVDIVQDLRRQIDEHESKIMKEELEELRLRDRNPSLKDAWDQYQTMKELVKNK